MGVAYLAIQFMNKYNYHINVLGRYTIHYFFYLDIISKLVFLLQQIENFITKSLRF